MEKPADNQFPIHELLRSRWSPRAFSAQPVRLDNLLSLFEAARWAPSGGNLQPWFFIIADSQDEEAHARFAQIINERNASWAKHAPVLVLAVAKMERSEGQPNVWALYDLGQSVAHLNIQATALGLGMHQIGGFDKQKARALLSIPDGYEPAVMMAIGYQGDLDNLSEDLRQRELQARSRRPVPAFTFRGAWEQPLPVEEDRIGQVKPINP